MDHLLHQMIHRMMVDNPRTMLIDNPRIRLTVWISVIHIIPYNLHAILRGMTLNTPRIVNNILQPLLAVELIKKIYIHCESENYWKRNRSIYIEEDMENIDIHSQSRDI